MVHLTDKQVKNQHVMVVISMAKKKKIVHVYMFFFLKNKTVCSYNQSNEILDHKCYNRKLPIKYHSYLDVLGIKSFCAIILHSNRELHSD